ncbi:MAG: hypothetical protein JKX85_13415 [Phycisphaeraceae bacterium]|nr:hypothetical protein [Phycisphaeraceae bacterium]
MRQLIFTIVPSLFTLVIMFLFGIGIIRMDTDNHLLRSVDCHAGFLYTVLPTNIPPRVRGFLDQASVWLGSPCITPADKTVARTTTPNSADPLYYTRRQ